MAIRKELLRRRGAFAHAAVRAPGTALDDGTKSALDRLLAWMKDGQRAPWISV
jgi:dihydrodipicolinate synthase/N-acetylneuraminate lyase